MSTSFQDADATPAVPSVYEWHPLYATLLKFVQCMKTHTKKKKTLDFLNVSHAYFSVPLPPFGRPDHNLMHNHTSIAAII